MSSSVAGLEESDKTVENRPHSTTAEVKDLGRLLDKVEELEKKLSSTPAADDRTATLLAAASAADKERADRFMVEHDSLKNLLEKRDFIAIGRSRYFDPDNYDNPPSPDWVLEVRQTPWGPRAGFTEYGMFRQMLKPREGDELAFCEEKKGDLPYSD